MATGAAGPGGDGAGIGQSGTAPLDPEMAVLLRNICERRGVQLRLAMVAGFRERAEAG